MKNQMEMTFASLPENEAFARMVISAFFVRVNPTLSMISEVRTAVSEAVTNAVVHAYKGKPDGRIVLRASVEESYAEIEVEDFGCGIDDVEQAMQPFFTTQPEKERSGMGFSLMLSFMDGVKVESQPGCGTCVTMRKWIDEADEADALRGKQC